MARSSTPRTTSTRKAAASRRTEPTAPDTSTQEHDGHPTHDEIRQCAYEIFMSRGGSPGRDFEDWLQAERELADERRSRRAS